MSYQLIWEAKGVIWQFSDHVDYDQIIRAGMELLNDPRATSIEYRVCDFLAITSMEVSSDEALKIAALDLSVATKNPHIKVALVAKLRMMKRMINFYVIGLQSSSWDARLFDNMEEARAWLALPAEL